jgi:hypothetical protein
MTYFPPSQVDRRLECAVCSWGGSPAVGSAFDVTLINHTWSVAPSISGSEITLPAGHYSASAWVAITRTSAAQNVRFRFTLDGANIGLLGQSDMYLNTHCDAADAEFSVDEGTTAVLRITNVAVETSLPTVTANSRLVIWRTDRGTL